MACDRYLRNGVNPDKLMKLFSFTLVKELIHCRLRFQFLLHVLPTAWQSPSYLDCTPGELGLKSPPERLVELLRIKIQNGRFKCLEQTILDPRLMLSGRCLDPLAVITH